MFGCEKTQYLRSRNLKADPSLYFYHANAALEVAAESYNVLGMIELDVVYGAGREDDPSFENECHEWVASKEAAYPCYEVSWVAEATIDGHSAVRRLYRGFKDEEQARAFLESEPGEVSRMIDRHTSKAALAMELA
jgi:hypothetical protein